VKTVKSGIAIIAEQKQTAQKGEQMSDLCMVSNEPRETAKDIILNLAAILTEIKNQVDSIESAIYGKILAETNAGDGMEESPFPPMLMLLRQQRDFAEDILKIVIHIREGLW